MPINETFYGFIESTTDALLVFEACRRGKLPKISRRLQDRERGSIKSGTVFVFDERESGIKRWTDGLVWSPSRILGNFLIYRELDGRESLYQHNSRAPFDYDASHFSSPYDYGTQNDSMQSLLGEISNEERNRERNLVGSLTDTYKFRKGGLIKKTISIHLNGSTQHMISYYTRSDVLEGKLATPSSVSDLSNLQISPDLLLKQSFRVPPSVEFAESLLKRPSLSPTSTNSTTSTTATTTTGIRRRLSHATTGIHSMYEIHPARVSHEEYPPLSLDHSRRSSFELGGNSRKYARTSIENYQNRRSSLFLPSSDARSLNTDKILSFPPLPPPPRPPHYLSQYHHEAAPALPMNSGYTRTSSGTTAPPTPASKCLFNATNQLHSNNNNRLMEQQQRYQQPSVSNDALTRSLFKQDTQDAPFRFQRHYDNSNSNSSSSSPPPPPLSSLYERENGPSLPSPSSLIWSSSTLATNSTNGHHSLLHQDCDTSRMMYYQRPSSPPLSQPNTTATSPLSLEPTSTYSSPTSTYHQHPPYYRCERQYSASSSASIHQQLFSSSSPRNNL
ncbi:Global transcription regulator sge1 [Mucor circinelloides]